MSRMKCSFRNCQLSKFTHPNLHFFTFPIKDKKRCSKWISNCQRPILAQLPEKKLASQLVCQLHFEDKCFMNSLKQRLTGSAVPTLEKSSILDKNEIISPVIYISLEKNEESIPLNKQYCDVASQTDFFDQKYIKKIFLQNSKRSILMSRMRAKISHLKKKEEKIMNRKLSKEEVFTQLKHYFPEEALVFLQMQIMHIDPGQWRIEERDLALKMYDKSPRLYNFMRDSLKLKLPTMTTIRKWKKELEEKTDMISFNDEISPCMIEVDEIVYLEPFTKGIEIYQNLEIPDLASEEILITE